MRGNLDRAPGVSVVLADGNKIGGADLDRRSLFRSRFVYPGVYGPQAALFSELFDTRVRYTGVSFVYQFSGIFASGLTPIVATALLAWNDKEPWLICAYILVVSIISALCVYAMPETLKRDMATDEKAPAAPQPLSGAQALP